jgi:hypothetical protein
MTSNRPLTLGLISEVIAMKRCEWKRLDFVTALLVSGFLGYQVVHWLRWRERADSATGVALELRPFHQVIKVGEAPDLAILLVNRGKQEVVLVQPGDGSECGWRTPLIEWSQGDSFGGARWCGNINALTAEEVFTLKPGESQRLCSSVGIPLLAGPGRYRVAVRYINTPELSWSGVPLSEHDRAALQAVHRSAKVSAVSNAVEIVVEE